MRTSRHLTVVLALAVFGFSSCTKSTTPPLAPNAEAPAPTTTRLAAPVTVKWEKLELTASKARLMARINRNVALNTPVTVRIEVPANANMVIGRTSFELPANSLPSEFVEPVELHYGQLPVQDAVLHVKAGGPSGGFSYDVPFRFGRAAPGAEAPVPSGEHVINNGKDLGPAIPLDAKQPQE